MPSTPLTCCSIDTTTPGGVIRGYWAMGSAKRAIPPIKVMTMDSTAAKIGRSMKNRAIMARARSALGLVLRRRRRPSWLVGGRGRLRRGRLRRGRLRRGWLRRDSITSRVPAERRHGPLLGVDRHAGPDLLQAGHDDPFIGLKSFSDHAQSIVLERGRGDPAVLDLVRLVSNVDELDSLVRADCSVDQQDGGMGLAAGQANPH